MHPDTIDTSIKKLPCDLDSPAGRALAGKHLQRIDANALIDTAIPRALRRVR